jgi:hypothetical protein
MRRRNAGTVLLAFAVCLAALIGMAALTVDVSRMYIAKSELQTFTDSGALAGTLQLDGTQAGINRARTVAVANTNKWNFATRGITGAAVEFGESPEGPFEPAPPDAEVIRCVRVLASVDVPLTFGLFFRAQQAPGPPVAMLALSRTTSVRGTSAAGQTSLDGLSEGLFPFSPFAHDTTAPHFGLVPGQRYTLRWAGNPKLNQNVCSGDNTSAMISLAEAGGGSERGFIEETSASNIRAAIEGDHQTVTRYVGDQVQMTGGAMQTTLASLVRRINQDTDTNSSTYAEYISINRGNGRRIVAAPINSGYPDYRIVQIGAFLLLTEAEYSGGGNHPFCAEYAGSYIFGANHKAAAPSGAYVARLIR